jgi:hypothetical protein
LGKRQPRARRILTDADWPFASRHPVRQVKAVPSFPEGPSAG